MATKRKPKSEPILNAEPLKSDGVIVTHREHHITPGNASITWLIVMMALIGASGALCTYIWWQKEDLSAQIEAPYMMDNGRYTHNFLRGLRDKLMMRPTPVTPQPNDIATIVATYYKIEKWDAYTEITKPEEKLLNTSCVDDETGEPVAKLNDAIAQATKGKMYRLALPGGQALIYTTRPKNFPVDQVFNSLCGELGSAYLLSAYDDKLLWSSSNTCGGVAYTSDEDPDGHLTQQLADCQQTQAVLKAIFPQS